MARRSYSYIDVGADEARGYRQPRPRDGYTDTLTRRRLVFEPQSYSYIDRREPNTLLQSATSAWKGFYPEVWRASSVIDAVHRTSGVVLCGKQCILRTFLCPSTLLMTDAYCSAHAQAAL